MSSSPLRVAVVGIGHLGRHHARILATLDGARLTAVVDTIPERAADGSGHHRRPGARPTPASSAVGWTRSSSRCRPTSTSRSRCRCCSDGVAVLVEKPMAPSLAAADEMIAAARASGATLAVGHTERHNPAVAAVLPLCHLAALHRSPSSRCVPGPQPRHRRRVRSDDSRSRHHPGAGRVADQIDRAVGVPVLTNKFDIANARLRFASGCIANVTASRISRERVRKIRFFQPDAYMSIDYGAQEVEGWRLVRRDGARPSIEGGALPVERDEPLRRELADFVARGPREARAAG